MSTAAQPDDLVHDEYLRAALRHAPDHGLTAPSSITQNIFAAARQVHRPVRRAATPAPVRATIAGPSRWREVLRFLGSPRWAGGFATGLVAALVVGLWIDSEFPSPVAPAPEASTGVPGRDTAQPSPAAGSTVESRGAAAAADASRDTPPAAAVSTPVPARTPDLPAPAAPAVKQPGDADAARDGTARAAAASPALTLLRRIRAESAAQSAQWTWQPPGTTAPQPVDADGEAWLLRLVQAARGRWVDVAVPSDPGSADEVRWWRDGQPHARLRIEAGGLRWLETSGRIRFAPLEPPALERLRGR